jgi:polysaccharide chain length determinant protein (PEP-CTERM system associated)
MLLHRKWLVLSIFAAVSAATAVIASRLPNIYTSETVILVDPQKVPESYVKATITGDIRNRLGTLSQQILSATRLQRIIETLNLYPEERKKLAREDIISKMRSDISVSVISDFSANQDLQAFRITYSGGDSRLVARVTNELASLFIEENLKAREQQATGTTEFIQNQMEETRKALEEDETKLKEFKLKHIGEMPEQQAANIQILGQLQSQLQLEADALSRAEQQKSYVQSQMVPIAPVVDLDDVRRTAPSAGETKPPTPSNSALSGLKTRLTALLARYKDDHPDVRRLKRQIKEAEAKESAAPVAESAVTASVDTPPPAAEVVQPARQPVATVNPVLRTQLSALDAQIARYREEMQRISKSIAVYRAKLEAIPVREQEIVKLQRDYEAAKAHYSQLSEKQLSAETATQLEIRQKGEKFEILDPGQAAERPSRPNRTLINVSGSLSGLLLGVLLAIGTEFLGVSITSPEDITAVSGLSVLEVIPVIRTEFDQRLRRRRLLLSGATALVTTLGVGAILFYRGQI